MRLRTALVALAAPALLRAQSPVVARIELQPAVPVATVGQPLQLTATAVDSAGRVIPGVPIRFVRSGGIFEGSVDQTGLVNPGAPGTLTINISALAAGQRPVVRRVNIPVHPGPAATLALAPAAPKVIVGQALRLSTTVRSAQGDERKGDRIMWTSSAPRIATVSAEGHVRGVAAGRATITAVVDGARQTTDVQVIGANLRNVSVAPAITTARTGDVIRFALDVTDAGGAKVTGLTPTWLFNPGEGVIGSDGAFTAYQPGEYTVVAQLGQQTASATITVVPRDVKRPAEIVGSLVMSTYSATEVWLHPNGKVAYLGTLDGGRVYVIDVSDPKAPTVVDSVMPNARLINDVMTSEDGKVLVVTREGADDRRNGIQLFTLDDPRHPKPAAEFDDPVTSGVHSAFVYTDPTFGRHVYLTADAVGRLVVANIDDPAKPRMVGSWEVPRTDQGRYLHDIDVQDGILYGSYLNDGLVILDVGNGMKGGTPQKPVLISQFKYDLVGRRAVAEATGAQVIGGTHTAWRHGRYVFVGDEIIPFGAASALAAGSMGRMFGGLQVIDVSDLEHPKSVAWYEPEHGGVHNLWVAGDTLYMGAYNAGFRTFDISGELRGDLRAQGREMVSVMPTSPNGKVPNAAMTWGVVVRDGLAYVPDMNGGLFIIRMGPKQSVVP